MTSLLMEIAEALGDDGAKYKCRDHLAHNIISNIRKLQLRLKTAEEEYEKLRTKIQRVDELILAGVSMRMCTDPNCVGCDEHWDELYRKFMDGTPPWLTDDRYPPGISKKMVRRSGPLCLKTGGENDFILDGTDEFWVEIGNIVVYVRKTEDAVTVDLTPKVSAHETLDCCSADFGMAKEFECTECGKYNNDGEGFNGLCSSCADEGEKSEEES